MGAVVYKLLITDFLIYVIKKTRQTPSTSRISSDLLVFCLRKIARRLNKIEGLLLSMDSNNEMKWIENRIAKIKKDLILQTPKSNWQDAIERDERLSQHLFANRQNPDQAEVYRHPCEKLKAYLQKTNQINIKNQLSPHAQVFLGSSIKIELDKNQLPSISDFCNQHNYSLGVALTRVEIWIEHRLSQWMTSEAKSFENLLNFFENYQTTALKHYYSDNKPSDPAGYSRFILTSLTIIRAMHQHLCTDQRFKRLQLHTIRIPHLLELFEYLVLPTREDMIRARDLFDFFYSFTSKWYPNVLENIDSKDAFGVHFATHSLLMKNTLEAIQTEAEIDKQKKKDEIDRKRTKYQALMEQASELLCGCDPLRRIRNCKRCRLVRQANNIKAHIYECPIPSDRRSGLAVVFELQMPAEFRCYRDVLWLFINRFSSQPTTSGHEWLSVQPHNLKLRRYYNCRYDCKVKLISSYKSTTQSHYSTASQVAWTHLEDFLLENSLTVQITPSEPNPLENEVRILTPQLTDSNYKHLQFSLESTQFMQNRVIAEQSKCSLRLKPTQFVEFGSFRSGHRLQWMNLLSILKLESLPMDEESVAILLSHALTQYGPVTTNSNALIQSWCPESHEALLDDHLVNELISSMDHLLTDCGLNWQKELVLVIVTVIAMRIFTLCNSTCINRVSDLVLRCRQTGEKWIELISKNIHSATSLNIEKMNVLRTKIVNIGIACLLTFPSRANDTHPLLSSNDHIISLFKAVTTIHDNIFLNKKESKLSTFMTNLLRSTERILVLISPTISKLLEKTSYQGLAKFTATYRAVVNNGSDTCGTWTKRSTDVHDGWYDGQYPSMKVSIDCLTGTFLVDGLSVRFLPDQITTNPLFVRVFGDQVFEVQSGESSNVYITKDTFHQGGEVRYEFHFDDYSNQQLIIRESHAQTNTNYELIPPDCFRGELPNIFVNNYSHWMNKSNQQIEFRPVRFDDSNFLTDKHYILDIKSGFLTTTNIAENKQLLMRSSSMYFQNLFYRYFSRLDEESYVYILRDNASQITEKKTEQDDGIVYIHLSRLGIAFKYNTRNDKITSREYPDMYVDNEQWFGTLTGLKAGLLLSPIMTQSQDQKHYLCRKLIISYGQIQVSQIPDRDHQIVNIERSQSLTPFLHQYFVFILNDRLRVFQATDSPRGSLYLALLHAVTSYSLPDEYTGMTGMERAFQLLNSAGCYSDQPYDPLSLNILLQIANLSPSVNYYPEHLTCMVRIEWNNHGLPRSMQHFGYCLIAKKLFETSEQWNFMHASSKSEQIKKLFENKNNNEKLLIKLYWDYRDSYNPIARLSEEIEIEIRSTTVTKPYNPVWKNYPQFINYRVIELDDHLYLNGDINLKDSSELKCFPLNRWLTSEYQLKNIWIGLVKLLKEIKTKIVRNQHDEIAQIEILLDFLRYISDKCSYQPYYLQILTSILKTWRSLPFFMKFPSFTQYTNIQHTTFEPNEIPLGKLGWRKRSIAIEEIESCFTTNSYYKNEKLTANINTYQVNMLFESWRQNAEFRSCLIDIQTYINSIPIGPFQSKLPMMTPRFTFESFLNHYQIQLYSQSRSVDQMLLAQAQQKFHNPHSDYFIKPKVSNQITNQQTKAPDQIFPSTDANINELSSIANHYKKQFVESWQKFQSAESYQNEYPSATEITEFLNALRNESTDMWNELVKSITLANEQLFQIGLMFRTIPSILISNFHQIWLNEAEQQLSQNKRTFSSFLTVEQRTLLGGIMVNWIVEQQIERALYFHNQNKIEDFETELSNVPHSNWIPSKHLPWLILQLEMNITIRAIQVDVTRHMTKPSTPLSQSIVMQMNMGEGKTSVILPMLALSLCSPTSSLVRIIVLRSLFPMNYQSLRYKLGGLLNRRVLPFACRRDMNFTQTQVNQILNRLKQGLKNRDVMLTSPEDILSYELLTIDKCRREEYDTGGSMLGVQRWLKTFARDILDESDEILHVKYQLIYSIGGQKQVDGGAERWETIQLILHFVKRHATTIAQQFTDDVFYKSSKSQSSFSEFRLLSHKPFGELCKLLVNNWLSQKNFHPEDEELISSFILKTDSSIDNLTSQFPPNIVQSFLILRGFLSSEVLLVGLKRRYRVKYGINPNPKFKRLMAVPFRAKDVATENTEFGHPDVAILLTQLAYYYNGLNDSQMLQCFERMIQDEKDPDTIYEEWMRQEGRNNVHASIRNWKGVNLKDNQQKTEYLFPALRQNMLVVNYYLNHFVFPREAKQFPEKLVASAWDLSSSARTNIITGFSGTNDTQLLLPIDIKQYDLPELRKTDAIVLNNLLQSKNERYESLSTTDSSNEILKRINDHRPMIQVILDVGALFTDGTNCQIAKKWLDLSDKNQIDYAIYFEKDEVYVCDRLYRHHAFSTSPASERLERCVFYLDEIHTRGTDFKFPNNFRAAVTLGNGLTKDRLVQACMRMRKLGTHHSLSFWSSNEVHLQIQALKRSSAMLNDDKILLADILRWVYVNTQYATWDGLHHWAAQSLSFQRKTAAFQSIRWNDSRQLFTDTMMKKIATACVEPEVLELKSMYGVSKTLQTVATIYNARYKHMSIYSSPNIHQAVNKRLCDYGGTKQLLAQLLEDEQQRELEQEMEEERQQQRPPPVNPHTPVLHDEIKSLCNMQSSKLNLSTFPSVFRPLSEAFRGTTFYRESQPNCWPPNMWVSAEFVRVIRTSGESLDPFLRPVRWVVVYRNEHIIFVSPFEANVLASLLHRLKGSLATTLRLLLPRTRRDQSIIINNLALTIPPSIKTTPDIAPFLVPVQFLAAMFVFNGTLYFENGLEQRAYCHFLGVCPKPRTEKEEKAFHEHWISIDGFVENILHRPVLQIHSCHFRSNPLLFVRKLVENRNNAHASLKSHVGGIIMHATKHTFQSSSN